MGGRREVEARRKWRTKWGGRPEGSRGQKKSGGQKGVGVSQGVRGWREVESRIQWRTKWGGRLEWGWRLKWGGRLEGSRGQKKVEAIMGWEAETGWEARGK